MERIFVLINTEKTTDLNQISLTGVRSILLLWMLIDGPKTLEEIREELYKLQVQDSAVKQPLQKQSPPIMIIFTIH